MKRIISYNVNGIRAAAGKGLLDWIKQADPDILCIQETKAQSGQMHEADFEKMGYHFFAFSAEKKGYSGVAIACKQKPDHVEYGMGNPKYDVEGRVIRADFGDWSVISAYFPSGTTGDVRQEFKMDFLSDFHIYLQQLRKERPKLVISGDYNICRLWIDIHNPEKQQTTSGFLPEEREWFQQFIDDDFVDSFRKFNAEPHQYSWWSYRAEARANNKGWRIDYHIVTSEIENRLLGAAIFPEALHSDHCPVMVEVDY
ncbi:MAG: exodeoxyribonuclease III [Prolixibacteraceae bacterium]|nr:exodeoxyribonuclease III [Prolixibacteraceae bacterium]